MGKKTSPAPENMEMFKKDPPAPVVPVEEPTPPRMISGTITITPCHVAATQQDGLSTTIIFDVTEGDYKARMTLDTRFANARGDRKEPLYKMKVEAFDPSDRRPPMQEKSLYIHSEGDWTGVENLKYIPNLWNTFLAVGSGAVIRTLFNTVLLPYIAANTEKSPPEEN